MIRRGCLPLAAALLCNAWPVVAAASDDVTTELADASIYQLDTSASELRILVYRAGALGKLGHNHVIVSRGMTGTVYRRDPLGQSSFTLSVPVVSREVDPDTARAEEGDAFATQPSAKDIAATQRNMLGKRLLKAERFPDVTVEGLSLTGTPPEVIVHCRIGIAGNAVLLQVPASLSVGHERLTVSGELSLSHTELGLKRFRVMLGALQVAEDMTLKFRLLASRTEQ